MVVLGLTGSIGMGKTTTAAMFREAGCPVYDADAAVSALYAPGGAAVPKLAEAFPGVVQAGAVDREALRQAVVGSPRALERLNALVHPLVAQERDAFLAKARAASAAMVVLDIPLLFEVGLAETVDAIAVVTAPSHIQRERVLGRQGMTAERFDALLAAQVPDAEKRRRADFIVDSSLGLEPVRLQVAEIIAALADPDWKPRRDRTPA
jgi:dephospho-CoA kinase